MEVEQAGGGDNADRLVIEQRLALGGPLRPRSAEEFESSYDGRPPWDIDRPQQAFVALFENNEVTGRVLDVGCGTGEHALAAAQRGHDATGVDLSTKAIERARAKSVERGVEARFLAWDCLDLVSLDETFDTVLDSGLFHVLSDPDRVRYAEQVAAVLVPGGRLHILCFSDRQSGDWGPRRVSETEIRTCFTMPFEIEALEPAFYESTVAPGRSHAWRVAARRR